MRFNNRDDIRPADPVANDAIDERTKQEEYDNFHESMATPASPMYTRVDRTPAYVMEPTLVRANPLATAIRTIGSILATLLGLRILMGLINPDQGNALISALYSVTDWMVRPFASFIGLQNLDSGKYFDWPALVALAVVAIVAYLIARALDAYRRDVRS